MTLEAEYVNKSVYSGDGATQTFDIDFSFRRKSEIVVQVLESDIWVRQTEGTDYEIQGNTVVFLATGEPASGTDNVEIWRVSSASAADIVPSDVTARVIAPGKPWDQARIETTQRAPDPLSTQLGGEAKSLIGWEYLMLQSVQSVTTGTAWTKIDGLSTQTVGITFPYPVEFGDVGVVSYHNDSSSPPTTWNVQLRVDRGSGDVILANGTLNWNAAVLTEEATIVTWTPVATGETVLHAEPGEIVSIKASGAQISSPTINFMFAYRLRRPAA